ncbi:MAG: pectate lyase [Bryobacteraceae bacterium]
MKLSLLLFVLPLAAQPPSKYLAAVREFADHALKHGRDVYDSRHTPLFVDGLNVDTLQPVTWISTNGAEWVLSNLGNQQVFFRTLDGLSSLTGDARYRQAAIDATLYAYKNLDWGGLLYWGGHAAYNATADTFFFSEDKGKSHELKEHFPHYDLMWKADPARTRVLIESIWNDHVLDWSKLDFNRHGSPRPMGRLWKNEFLNTPVFFWGKGLTFVNAGSDLYLAAAMLSHLDSNPEALAWARRLALRYVETRNPKTGIGGYQFSQTNAWCDGVGKILGDRAQYQYAESFPGHHVVEGTLFPCYGDAPGVNPQLCQMAIAERLGPAGADFRRWAIEELTAWAKSAYRASDNTFIPMLTDGASMEGFVVKKDGYFGPKGRVLRAGKARPSHFWAYAEAWRQSSDALMWDMARRIAQANGYGDIDGKLEVHTTVSDAGALFGFLALYRKTQKRGFLEMAARIGDNILAAHFVKGFFVRSANHVNAKFDAVEPLALLHLEAARQGRPNAVPVFHGTGAFFAAAYANKGHQYDSSILYGRGRKE